MRPVLITCAAWALATFDSIQYTYAEGLEAALWAGLCGASIIVMLLGAWEVSHD